MFDTNVHRRNSDGKVVHSDPYRLTISNGESRYERPVGSGMWYAADGTLIQEPEKKADEKPADAAAHSHAKHPTHHKGR